MPQKTKTQKRQKKQKKDATTATIQVLETTVKKLRTQLAAAEKAVEKWKRRAKKRQNDVVGLEGELTAARRREAKAEASKEKWKGRATSRGTASAAATAPVTAAPVTAEPVTSEPVTPELPDESWTVTALRAEARSRGIPGYSRKPKSQLLLDLRG